MAVVLLSCVVKPHPNSPHEDITDVGTASALWTRKQVIGWIEAGTDTFYIMVGGRRSEVGVVRESGKEPCLRARADGHWNDDLLALPHCR